MTTQHAGMRPAHQSISSVCNAHHKRAVRLASLSRPSLPRRFGALFPLPPPPRPGRLRLRSPTPNTSPERRAEIKSSNSPAPLVFLSPSILPRSSLPFSCTSAANLASRLLCLSLSIWDARWGEGGGGESSGVCVCMPCVVYGCTYVCVCVCTYHVHIIHTHNVTHSHISCVCAAYH